MATTRGFRVFDTQRRPYADASPATARLTARRGQTIKRALITSPNQGPGKCSVDAVRQAERKRAGGATQDTRPGPAHNNEVNHE